jgi:hypothetical protein
MVPENILGLNVVKAFNVNFGKEFDFFACKGMNTLREPYLFRHDVCNVLLMCEIVGFHCGVPEFFRLLGCYAA